MDELKGPPVEKVGNTAEFAKYQLHCKFAGVGKFFNLHALSTLMLRTSTRALVLRT